MMTLSQLAQVINATWRGPDVTFTSVGADSRAIKAGQLFVALAGERFDGHAFVEEALAKGAAAVLINENSQPSTSSQPALIVADTYAALGQIAAYWRAQFSLPLIAVTGSAGKTTVKEMLASILQNACNPEHVLATEGNLNNHIGMPMTVLKLNAQHQYAVIEMGMNHRGEIAYLSEIAQPTIALINNAGSAHIGELGSLEAIAQAKGEIFTGLRSDGIAIINQDDRFAPLWEDLTQNYRHIRFGLHPSADVHATYTLAANHVDMHLYTPIGSIDLNLPAAGLHNVYNALAASSAALAAHVSLTAIKAGLEHYQGIKGRMQLKAGVNGAVVIDDTYNANPVAMKAAIDVLAAKAGRKYLILGDIGELGEQAATLHAEVGVYASRANIDGLFTLGDLSLAMTEAYNGHQETQQHALRAQHFTTLEALIAAVVPYLQADSTILVKGSRFMAMERVVDQLLARSSNQPHITATNAVSGEA